MPEPMPAALQPVTLTVDGAPVTAAAGTNLAALLLGRGAGATRSSVTGEPRAPLCGMGVCHECRVTVDGVPHVRACMVTCRAGLVVVTGPFQEAERATRVGGRAEPGQGGPRHA